MANLRKEFSKIYDRYVNKIYRFIFLKVDSLETAQDLTAETFLRTWEKFQQSGKNSIENPQAFLYQTARNLVIDHYREKSRMQVVSAEFVPIRDPRENLEEKTEKISDLTMIKNALAEINDDYQNIIIWHYLDDIPIREAAKMMGRTEGATRVLLHRALNSLRETISQQLTRHID